jgi:hypothetical protein
MHMSKYRAHQLILAICKSLFRVRVHVQRAPAIFRESVLLQFESPVHADYNWYGSGRGPCSQGLFPRSRSGSGFVFQRRSPEDTTLSESGYATRLFKVGKVMLKLVYNWLAVTVTS